MKQFSILLISLVLLVTGNAQTITDGAPTGKAILYSSADHYKDATTFLRVGMAEGYCDDVLQLTHLHAFIVTMPDSVDYDQFETHCKISGLFSSVYEDTWAIYQQQYIPNDPNYPLAWFIRQSNDKDIDADIAWDSLPSGNTFTTVAVFDGGYDPNHPDLIGHTNGAYNAVLNNGDCSFINLNDKHGHTCGGVFGAGNNNGIGVPSVGDNKVQYMPVRIINTISASGTFTTSAAYQVAGVNAVMGNPTAVCVSMSYGGTTGQAAFQEAINIASATGRNGKGILFFASTGNNSNNTTVNYPAAFNNVVGVGATSSTDAKASFSTWSWTCDLSAPGVGIVTTDRVGADGYSTNDYAIQSGTSYSCPMVAGVGAVMFYKNFSMTASECLSILASTAEKVGGYAYAANPSYPLSTRCPELGYGRINFAQAINAVPSAGTVSPPPALHNLQIASCSTIASSINVGQYLGVTCAQVTMNPELPAVTTIVQYRYSTDNVLSSNDIVIGTDTSIVGGGTVSQAEGFLFQIPAGSGTRYIIMTADYNNQILESTEYDNSCYVAITVVDPVLSATDAMPVITTIPITTCNGIVGIYHKFRNLGSTVITSITYSRRWLVCTPGQNGAPQYYQCTNVYTWTGSLSPGAITSTSYGVSSPLYFYGLNTYEVKILTVNGMNADGNPLNNIATLPVTHLVCDNGNAENAALIQTRVYSIGGFPIKSVPAGDQLDLQDGMYILHEEYSDGSVRRSARGISNQR